MTGLLTLAHGVGGRTDLPLSAWQAGWSAAVALVLSFAALGLAWHKPRLRRAADGPPLGWWPTFSAGVVGSVARWALVVETAVVVTAGLAGIDDVAVNVAPVAIYVAFWVGVPLLVVLAGPWWSTVSPWETLFRLVDRVRTGRSAGSWAVPAPVGDGWLAVVPVAAFLWLELAYHDGARPRVLGWAAFGYTLVLLGVALRWGTGAARCSEGFGVLFGLLARLSPIGRAPGTGRPVLRLPLVGATADKPASLGGDAPAGGARRDGLRRGIADPVLGRRLGWVRGWGGTGVGTLGLIWLVAVVGVAWHLASRLGDRLTGGTGFSERFGHSLLPIVLGYHVAHYFSLLVLEGQLFWIRASDPYGRGWDLFGTAGDSVDWTRVSPGTVGWVQLGAIVAGHLGGVFLAHDRSIESWRPSVALRSQYPLLVVMVAYTVAGLVLMTG
ncbi:MAG: hypothetical protein CM1200mP26_09120 [Acidimicrobiales bacterium]|nr:MAG: hypothetical protein CM1200mP26_09120 [Acidimicrobiales bacterium]